MIKYDRLKALATFLEKLPVKKFNFRTIVSEAKEKSLCGTVCCALGWMPKVSPDAAKWVKAPHESGGHDPLLLETADKSGYFKSYYAWEYDVSAHRLFNVTCEDASYLFAPNQGVLPWDKHLPADLRGLGFGGNVSPQDVAASIKAFIRWKKATSRRKSAKRNLRIQAFLKTKKAVARSNKRNR